MGGPPPDLTDGWANRIVKAARRFFAAMDGNEMMIDGRDICEPACLRRSPVRAQCGRNIPALPE
jgi:hypothetical protein